MCVYILYVCGKKEMHNPQKEEKKDEKSKNSLAMIMKLYRTEQICKTDDIQLNKIEIEMHHHSHLCVWVRAFFFAFMLLHQIRTIKTAGNRINLKI